MLLFVERRQGKGRNNFVIVKVLPLWFARPLMRILALRHDRPEGCLGDDCKLGVSLKFAFTRNFNG